MLEGTDEDGQLVSLSGNGVDPLFRTIRKNSMVSQPKANMRLSRSPQCPDKSSEFWEGFPWPRASKLEAVWEGGICHEPGSGSYFLKA